jgi:3,4-dihydroxy 2-butanone 4-phosphate synthase/GTP cyclohydrolase II
MCSVQTRQFHTIEEALEDIRHGKMVVLLDDEDRENEGDLTIAAEKVTPAMINFMAMHGRGLICLALTPERLAELQIPPMVEDIENTSYFRTAFTVSIEARRGVTTGISAADRATTILTAVNPKTKPEDLVRPGHIFPLRARAGGVLERAGQTEGAVDLARLAGLAPAGVICEVLNDDGTMAHGPQLMAFAERLGLKIVTIKDLIHYRMQRECLVRVVAETRLPLRFGEFRALIFEHEITREQHIALVKGELTPERAILARIHSSCLTGDVFGSFRCDCGEQLKKALRLIAEEGVGILLYLNQEGRGIGLANKIRAYALQDTGLDTVQANEDLGFQADLREYGTGAQILVRLGVKRLRLMTNNPRKVVALEGFGLQIVERVPLQVRPGKHNARYLRTKHEKLGHLFDSVDEPALHEQQEWW